MNDSSNKQSINDDKMLQAKVLELRVAFWQKRLDHTLQHTQTATKLIYLADGAVLGFFYFWIKALEISRAAILMSSFPILLLAIMNYFHGGLIGNQGSWYRGIDQKLRNIFDETDIKHTSTKLSKIFFKSTVIQHQAIHLAIAALLLVASILMFLYGIGCFSDIVPIKNVQP